MAAGTADHPRQVLALAAGLGGFEVSLEMLDVGFVEPQTAGGVGAKGLFDDQVDHEAGDGGGGQAFEAFLDGGDDPVRGAGDGQVGGGVLDPQVALGVGGAGVDQGDVGMDGVGRCSVDVIVPGGAKLPAPGAPLTIALGWDGDAKPVFSGEVDRVRVTARGATIAASDGENLSDTARNLLLGTIVVIGLYLTFRFDFPFALGASLALLHDVLMTIGFIGVFQLEPNIPLVAAVLTIIGYSINDTIVIFDRIRENVQDRQQATLGATVDLAITQTLSRTIITSILTFLSVLALLIGGVESLREFALVLGFGIVIGTYSSIFIASPMVQIYEQFRRGRA